MNARFNTVIGLAFGAANIAFGGPLSPDDERASFHLADASLAVELVASEPEVISPVAITWDARGRMFVAEMIDYPLGPKTGQVRMLEDRNRDGRYEKATVFADGLAFPNGVLAWKDGLLVTAAPDILFLKDTDGDGRADERRVLLTGFAEGNQQLRVNGLLWGLDGWVYGANGRSDGEIGRPGEAKKASLRGHDFRFRPETGEFEVIGGRSQFGLSRDDWGNRFLSWNTIAIRHEAIPAHYLVHSRMSSTDGIHDLTPPNDTGEVFPLTSAPQTFNKESTSHFNALAGLTIFRGDALPERYRGNAFVGETLRNLVHRRVLEPGGASFEAKRIEERKEFLASTDPWFHPVNFASGPDGALYIVDFYRQWVEHPGYVPEKMRGDIAWRTGAEHGRIWRVRGRDAKARIPSNLDRASTDELVRLLGHIDGWSRDTAQRLLIERRETKAGVKQVFRQMELPQARVQALETLRQLNALDESTLRSALSDRDARVRETAIRLSESYLKQHLVLAHQLTKLAEDKDARVRLQVVLSARECDDDLKLRILQNVAERDDLDVFTERAIRSSVGTRPWSLLEPMLAKPAKHYSLMDNLAGDVASTGNAADCRLAVKRLSEESIQMENRLAAVAGFAGVIWPRTEKIREWGGDYERMVKPLIGRAREIALRGTPEPLQGVCLDVLARSSSEEGRATVVELLMPAYAGIKQAAVVAAINEARDARLFEHVFAVWRQLQIETRRKLLAGAAGSAAPILLEALEEGRIAPAELDAAVRQSLLRSKSSEMRVRIQKLFDPLTNRVAAIEKFSAALRLEGDAQSGAQHFSRLCLQCHTVQGRGQRVGPDLSAIASRTPEALLIDILDPSRQVAADFVSYAVITTNSDPLDGLIVTDTATGITLRRAGVADQTIVRAEIQEVRASGRSLMPDGLEADMTVEDFADLIAFLRRPDPQFLPKE